MSARLIAGGVMDSIDRMDPTRSHESKPSARMSARRREWILIRSIAVSVISAAVVVTAVIASLPH